HPNRRGQLPKLTLNEAVKAIQVVGRRVKASVIRHIRQRRSVNAGRVAVLRERDATIFAKRLLCH
ncbi:MAG: hypothetical protein ABI777_08730, partial [Betaproteobacteria bacterium]